MSQEEKGPSRSRWPALTRIAHPNHREHLDREVFERFGGKYI